jgi:hypothetical protein
MWLKGGCPNPEKEIRAKLEEIDAQCKANYQKNLVEWITKWPKWETAENVDDGDPAFGCNFSWLPPGTYTVVNKLGLPFYTDYAGANANRTRLTRLRGQEAGRMAASDGERIQTPAGNWLEREPNEYERQGFLVEPKRVRRPKPSVLTSIPLPAGKSVSCAKIGSPNEREMVPIRKGARLIRYSLSDLITPPKREVKEISYSLIGSYIGFTPDSEGEAAKPQTIEDVSREGLISCDDHDPDACLD